MEIALVDNNKWILQTRNTQDGLGTMLKLERTKTDAIELQPLWTCAMPVYIQYINDVKEIANYQILIWSLGDVI